MKLSLLTAIVAAAVGSFAANAQQLISTAQVPFSFRVGETSMPAGKYEFLHANQILRVRAIAGSPSVFSLTNATLRQIPTTGAKLTFTRYGIDYYLTDVWNAFSTSGIHLPQTKREAELRHANRGFVAEIPLHSAAR